MLTEMQTCVDDKVARVAYESNQRKQAQSDLSDALDDFLCVAKKSRENSEAKNKTA